MLDPSRREPDRPPRLARTAAVCGASGKLCPAERATQLLEAIIEPGDRVVIEGDNQKQADFLAAALAKADPARLHDLHMVQSVLALPDHLVVFERGIANRFDFAFAGPQGRRLADRDARAHRAGGRHRLPRCCSNPRTIVRNMEKCHEGAYHCSRVGYADC
ncbi:MAG TPA: malonate decarboxylase subunit alpha [Stellaceae bacterium]|nr:malonate decarboxylase subunit alpha [Stellaceae bacterium]